MDGTIFPSLLIYALTCVVLVAAQLVYVTFGFGAGMIAVGSLALFYPDVKDVVVMLLLVNLPAELLVTWRSRREIRWRRRCSECRSSKAGTRTVRVTSGSTMSPAPTEAK